MTCAKSWLYQVQSGQVDWGIRSLAEARRRVATRRERGHSVAPAARTARIDLLNWDRLQSDYESRCFYCGAVESLVREHLTPLIRGGDHVAGNVVPACRTCNLRKASRTLEEYLKMLDRPYAAAADWLARSPDLRKARVAREALDSALRVKSTGAEEQLRPLTTEERRIVHLTVQAVPGVRTFSAGVGSRRRITIAPA
jgi:5-methylcytosine-specific restriction endonuclease McrA